MKTLVLYDSQFGNTVRISLAIADAMKAFGEARAARVNPAVGLTDEALNDIDLLFIGCPTQGWKATKAMQAFLKTLDTKPLRGVAVACFDTRFHKPRWLTGSAAEALRTHFENRGLQLIAPPESFFVLHTQGPLEDGEVERAARWAVTLANKVAVREQSAT